MKKMQCEVCGCTEIKKVSADIFECQGCGVQYSPVQVKQLLVDIPEENTPEKPSPEKVENDGVKDYLVIEPDVDPKENVKHFFAQLATTENIACDIFKEITIRSVTEKYATFYHLKAKYECEWSATACHVYYENQTVYKERYDAELRRHVKEPVTEKVERVNRVPQSGKHIVDSKELVLASNHVYDQLVVDGAKRDLISAFETQQDQKYPTYRSHKLDPKDIQNADGKTFYKGLELDLQVDQQVYDQRQDTMAEKASEQALQEIIDCIGGDFYENLNAIRRTIWESADYICIPVQIIEYTYKGKDYAAVSDLLSGTTTMPVLYPCDTELAEVKEEMKQQETKSAQVPGIFWLGMVGFGIGIILLVIAAVGGGDNFGFGAVGVWIASLICIIAGAVIRSTRLKAFKIEMDAAKQGIQNPRAVALSKSYHAFIGEYREYSMLSGANKAASVDSIPVTKTQIALSSNKPIRSVQKEENVLSQEEVAIMGLEEEIEALKKKRTLPIILMTVFGVLIIPLMVGAILLGNVNAQVNQKQAELNKMKSQWIKQ